MLQPENQNKKYERLFIEIHDGQIKIPNFQRSFVWDKLQTAKLIDSIIKGFPIGTFILWKTREEMRHYKSIGNGRCQASCRLNTKKISLYPQEFLMPSDELLIAHSRA